MTTNKSKKRTNKAKDMRPQELEDAIKECPVVYLPFGLIEWHGPHLPLGTDGITVEKVVEIAAKKSGGVVWPTCWFHSHYASITPLLREVFERMYDTDFKLIVVVTTHGDGGTLAKMAQIAASNLLYEKKISLLPITPSIKNNEKSSSDHAAKWETSHMLHSCPQSVDLKTLEGKEIKLDMQPPLGIGGSHSPLDGNAKIGKESIEIKGNYLSEMVLKTLETMTQKQREFHLPAISPEHWWFV